jgi:hypothetical protein
LNALVICRVERVHNKRFVFHGYKALAIIWPIDRLRKWLSVDAYAVKTIFPLKRKISKVFKLANLSFLQLCVDIALAFAPQILQPILAVDVYLRRLLLRIERIDSQSILQLSLLEALVLET